MSSESVGYGEFEPAEIVQMYKSTFDLNCTGLPGAVLLIYELCITFDQEVKLFWNRRVTGASVLFFCIRYTTFVACCVLNLVCFLATLSDASCALLIRSQTVIQEFLAFAALRVLALSRMKYSLAAIVFLLSLGPSVINGLQFAYGLSGSNLLTLGCGSELNESKRLTMMSSLIAADLIVVIVTIWATQRNGLLTTSWRNMSMSSLGDVMLYDGLLYFLTITCFNIANLVLTLVSIVTPDYSTSYVTALSDPVTAVLLCRFLFDLQAAERTALGLGVSAGCDTAADTFSRTDGTIVFASHVMGSLGASLGGPTGSTLSTEEDGEGGGGYWRAEHTRSIGSPEKQPVRDSCEGGLTADISSPAGAAEDATTGQVGAGVSEGPVVRV
ncbi:hypothetical protein BD413DRAFT_615533 [Trametes elegans]|nr:hypothetical protein BD413DRAFT_615533 [Trametes elegans]